MPKIIAPLCVALYFLTLSELNTSPIHVFPTQPILYNFVNIIRFYLFGQQELTNYGDVLKNIK